MMLFVTCGRRCQSVERRSSAFWSLHPLWLECTWFSRPLAPSLTPRQLSGRLDELSWSGLRKIWNDGNEAKHWNALEYLYVGASRPEGRRCQAGLGGREGMKETDMCVSGRQGGRLWKEEDNSWHSDINGAIISFIKDGLSENEGFGRAHMGLHENKSRSVHFGKEKKRQRPEKEERKGQLWLGSCSDSANTRGFNSLQLFHVASSSVPRCGPCLSVAP